MRSVRSFLLVLVLGMGVAICLPLQAHQVPLPKSAADVPGRALGTSMTKAYVQLVVRTAYVWDSPLVNSDNRRAAFAKAPESGLNLVGDFTRRR